MMQILVIFLTLLGLNSRTSLADTQTEIYHCEICGMSSDYSEDLLFRVVNGYPMKHGNKYPWIVVLQTYDSLGLKGSCMGSIISRSYILTAAHCLFSYENATSDCYGWPPYPNSCFLPPEKVKVIPMTDSSIVPFDIEKMAYYDVKRVITHPRYVNDLNYHPSSDLALLLLKHPLPCSRKMMPICLPESNMDATKKNVTIAGIGVDRKNPNYDPDGRPMQEGVVHQIPSENCRRRVNDTRWNLQEIFCTTGTMTEQSPCMGDSGSSMFSKFGETFYIVAVFSSVVTERCYPQSPISGVNMFHFLNWVRSIVKHLPRPRPELAKSVKAVAPREVTITKETRSTKFGHAGDAVFFRSKEVKNVLTISML